MASTPLSWLRQNSLTLAAPGKRPAIPIIATDWAMSEERSKALMTHHRWTGELADERKHRADAWPFAGRRKDLRCWVGSCQGARQAFGPQCIQIVRSVRFWRA